MTVHNKDEIKVVENISNVSLGIVSFGFHHVRSSLIKGEINKISQVLYKLLPAFLSRNPRRQWVRRVERCCHILKQDSQGDTQPAILSFIAGVYTVFHRWDLRRKRGPARGKRFIGLSSKAVRLGSEP